MAGQQLQEVPNLSRRVYHPDDVYMVKELKETYKELKAALVDTVTINSTCPFGLDPSYNLSPEVSKPEKTIECDEVYPSLLLGNSGAGKNIKYLKKIKVTHLLNAAEQAKTEANYYKDLKIKYLGYQLEDKKSTKIRKYFSQAADFIDEAISTGGRILVHCRKGVSRSATLVIVYLMIKKNMSIQDALRTVKKSRCIRPNRGFLRQLVVLSHELHE